MISSQFRRMVLSAALAVVCAGNAFAMNVRAIVQDDAGKPVKDAVVYATSLDSEAPLPQKPLDAVMDQQDREFVPYVLPIQAGTIVYFPNHDDLRHQVYSISPAKKFQLPLYKGLPPAPVLFDRPGAVALGCNIHDWMIAYIYVVETPYFTKTGEDGRVKMQNLPQGTYEVRVWHPLMKGAPESTGKRAAAAPRDGADNDLELSFRITLKPEWRPPRAPAVKGGEYR
jgi:plastocyanin